jgi:hypothetical protein
MRSIAPFLPMIALSCLLSLMNVAAIARGVLPPTSLLVDYAASGFLLLWVVTDARRRRCVPCHEFAFLVGVFLPVALPWYVFWTRGWRGLRVLAAFAGLILVPWAIGVVAYLIRYGLPPR